MNQILVSSNIFNTQGAWNDHYSGFELNTIYTSENVTHRKELENANIYVHSSLFKDIISNGGVFCLDSSSSIQKIFIFFTHNMCFFIYRCFCIVKLNTFGVVTPGLGTGVIKLLPFIKAKKFAFYKKFLELKFFLSNLNFT